MSSSWLAVFYWVHLLATAVWVGGLMLLALVALPAWRRQSLTDNSWLALQQRFTPWVNISMVLLWITGFVQMTNDPHYTGFLAIDGVWAWAMLLKHAAVVALMGVGLYVQLQVHPAMARLQLLREKKPQTAAATAAAEQSALMQREQRLLWVNLVCAALVLLFTAVATAVP